jgi:hypothetical protein
MDMKVQEYFGIKELVCKHVYDKWGEKAWQFLDEKLLANLLYIREGIGKPIVVNNWAKGGEYSQRGLRCTRCILVIEQVDLRKVYLSQHIFGKAVDFDVKGMDAESVRQWIKAHASELPYPCRVEENVSWVHMDVMNNSSSKVLGFYA